MSGSPASTERVENTEQAVTAAPSEHFARFYTHDETLVESVAAYVVDGVRGGAAAIVIATEQHLRSLHARWESLHFDAAAATASGQLILLDATQTLDQFMVRGAPDRERFEASVGALVARGCERYGSVAAFGEMVSLLWADNLANAAVELESFWNELGQRYRLRLFCGYALRDCVADRSDEAFEAVCAAHTHIIPAESYDPSSSELQRRAIAHLQRKALALEQRLARDRETQRSIAHMAAIIESSEDAILSKTLEGIIQSWNTGAQRLFGYSPAEAIGKSIALVVPPELLDDEQRILGALRRGERIECYETARVSKDGRRIDVSLTVSPVRDESGAIIGASTIARDITDRKHAEQLLRDAHRDLQARTAELARFNTAAVGRENRILALKREVNELRARLGEPAEYSFDETERQNRAPVLAYSAEPTDAELSGPGEGLVPLESILITEQLSRRASRPPDYETENRALGALVEALVNAPESILQVLADSVLGILRAGSAGLSLLAKDGRRFYWAAIAGGWSPHAGGGTPREFGPCGDVLDRDAPLLFTHWERRYPYLAAATPLAEEGLLVPFHVDGKAVGTIWAMAHDPERKFDAEDLRLLQSLARFAALAYQAVNTLGAIEERRAALSLLEDAVQARSVAEESLARLRESEEALREADRRKDEFLALLAHELRNPLAPIRYALAVNRKGPGNAERRKWADEMVERQIAHMSRLLDDLLDIARITRGTLELKKAPTELMSVLSAAIETARPLLDSRHHKLSLELPGEAVRLEVDAVRLAQVFSNLLINAAKYTDPHGEIRLSARRENGEIVVAVRDNGIGIAPDMLPRLFTMFAQADGVRGRAEGGLGVGLALVRGIVRLHGGTVRAHSAGLGRGSEFIVTLAAQEPQTELSQPESDDDAPVGNSVKVLVVDDNRDAADACTVLLEHCGHVVQTAYTGREALDLATTFQPHAVLLDIGLPELDGYTVAKRIRETAWGRRALLIAVTGWGQVEDRHRAQQAGFDHHLTKPVAAEAIEAALQTIGLRGRKLSGSADPETLPAS